MIPHRLSEHSEDPVFNGAVGSFISIKDKDILMPGRPTYEDLERKIKVLEDEVADRKRIEDLIRIQRDLSVYLSAAAGLEEGLRLCLDAALDVSGMDCGVGLSC